MKFLRSWLEEYIDLSGYSDEALGTVITNHSSEVEEITPVSDYFGGKVVVGRITSCRAHPSADRLKIFDVVVGAEPPVQIVSAAVNARDGIFVPVALVGATLPGITIAPRPMRGETSYGMCCGKSELLQEVSFSSGLWELEVSDSELGISICALYPEMFGADTLFDIKVLPDRIGNIGNYMGMATEIARVLGKTELLKGLTKTVFDGHIIHAPTLQKETEISIDVTDTTGLSEVFDLFRAKLTQSYDLSLVIKKRLFLTGTNLVNPLADLSNYIMFVTGQPVHFFDTISVTRLSNTRQWEIKPLTEETKFEGLGNLKHTLLSPGITVLADQDQILTVPAVTGGTSTKTEDSTQDIIVEIPMFDSNLAMKNAFMLKYRSDGLKIWASRSHPSRIVLALHMLAAELPEATISTIFLSTGKKLYQDFETQQNDFEQRLELKLDWELISKKFSKQAPDVVEQKLLPYLKLLGDYDGSVFSPRSLAYNFVEDTQSLVAELSYLSGVNDIALTNPLVTLVPTHSESETDKLLKLKQNLAISGFTEVMTRPFVSTGKIRVLKSVNQSMNYLRSELYPTLLKVGADNFASGVSEPWIFEINKLYEYETKLTERRVLVALLTAHNPMLAVQSIKSISNALGLDFGNMKTKYEITELGSTTSYLHNQTSITLTELSNKTKKQYGLPLTSKWWLIQTDITALEPARVYAKYSDLSQYPTLDRDYTLILNPSTTYQQISSLLPRSYGDIAIRHSAIGRFVADSGQVNLTIRLTCVSSSGTITPEDEQAISELVASSTSLITTS